MFSISSASSSTTVRHMGKIHGMVAVMVHQAAGGGHHDLAARFQLALLLVQPGTAVHADHA